MTPRLMARGARWVALTLAVAVTAVGCKSAADARTASPRAAAKAFAEAMAHGDADIIRQVSTGDDASLELMTTLANQNAAYERLEQAAAKRFGDPKQVISVGRAGDHYARIAAEIDAAPENVQGDQATVGAGLTKLYLKKDGEAWKVDRARLSPPPGSDLSGHMAMIRAMTKAFDEVTGGITSGAYDSAEAAKAAFFGKTMQAVLSQQPSATTGPATLPATTRPATTRAAD